MLKTIIAWRAWVILYRAMRISYLRGKRYEQEKKQHGVRGKSQNERGESFSPLSKTADKIADELNVTSRTIHRDAQFTRAWVIF